MMHSAKFNPPSRSFSSSTRCKDSGEHSPTADATETEVVQVMTALAAGSLTDVALAKWIRARLVRLKL